MSPFQLFLTSFIDKINTSQWQASHPDFIPSPDPEKTKILDCSQFITYLLTEYGQNQLVMDATDFSKKKNASFHRLHSSDYYEFFSNLNKKDCDKYKIEIVKQFKDIDFGDIVFRKKTKNHSEHSMIYVGNFVQHFGAACSANFLHSATTSEFVGINEITFRANRKRILGFYGKISSYWDWIRKQPIVTVKIK